MIACALYSANQPVTKGAEALRQLRFPESTRAISLTCRAAETARLSIVRTLGLHKGHNPEAEAVTGKITSERLKIMGQSV